MPEENLQPEGTLEEGAIQEGVDTVDTDSAEEQPDTLDTPNDGGSEEEERVPAEQYKSLQSEFTRRSQRLKELEQEMEQLRSSQQQPAQKAEDPLANLTPEERAQYEQVANTLTPFMRDKLDQMVEERVQARLSETMQQQEIRQMYTKKFEEVSKKAKDAGIKYNQDKLLEHMKQTGNADVGSAFRSLYHNELIDYEIRRRQNSKKTIQSAQGGSAKGASKEEKKYSGVSDPQLIKDAAAKLRGMLKGG